ncbi:cupin domain-containing protein [Actinomadura opuntiae]|uniref:cupin domain-containing protein n=1 Tax=Actinomadura sp. OS1-43 TaxID=604315 RepID=UPI00255A83F3|nr:cupin domain-containing protein [Actinomadura sp. OS1-43]MDL4821803.1 cupin domain-containing protein [Actinomadura sp. OS1-43]
MERRRMLHVFKAAGEVGQYEDAPLLPEHVDPQIYLSRNSVAQPFFLVCEKDSVIAQMSGRAQVDLLDTSVNLFDMDPGDMVYIPARTPHRIRPADESVQLRYKARHSVLEGAVWTCAACGHVLARREWELPDPPSRAYAEVLDWFNASVAGEPCPECGAEVPSIEPAAFSWAATPAAAP